MPYPDILGRHIRLMPEIARSAEWFATLPPSTQKRFHLIIKSFCLQVAAEYLRDNHGQDLKKLPKPAAKKEVNYVRGTIYADRITVHFEDGVSRIRPRGDFSSWRFVGYIDLPDRRAVMASKSESALLNRLVRKRLQLINGGVAVSVVTEPKVFPLRLQVAEDVGIRDAV
jgi:hypothetical protein